MNANKIMARMATTTQKKNTMMPGMAYPATVLALATTASYPPPRILFGAETQRQMQFFAIPAVSNRGGPLHENRTTLTDKPYQSLGRQVSALADADQAGLVGKDHRLDAVTEAKLSEHPADVSLHCALAEVEPGCDIPVG